MNCCLFVSLFRNAFQSIGPLVLFFDNEPFSTTSPQSLHWLYRVGIVAICAEDNIACMWHDVKDFGTDLVEVTWYVFHVMEYCITILNNKCFIRIRQGGSSWSFISRWIPLDLSVLASKPSAVPTLCGTEVRGYFMYGECRWITFSLSLHYRISGE